MKQCLTILSITFCLILAVGSQSLAYTSIANSWAAEYPGACATLQDARLSSQSCVLCHTSGFGLNSYADDLANAGNNFSAIEGMDSDNDGRTNLQEIMEDCRFPGDDTSVSNDQQIWSSVKALYR